MARYSAWERGIARVLESFPAVKTASKTVYSRLNHILYGESGFEYELDSRVTITTPPVWADMSSDNSSVFFGYYDKIPWSGDMSRYLVHEIINEEKVLISVFDAEKKKRTLVGYSQAWNHQQGAMAQWLNDGKIAYNDVEQERLGSWVVDLENSQSKFIPWPIQTVHPNGEEALSLNYKRLDEIRPEYGYEATVTNFSADMALSNDGIWQVDLESGDANLIVSLEWLRNHRVRAEMDGSRHKVNHAMYSPKGTRFVFMHRWVGDEGKFSRLYVADSNGSDLRILMDDRMISHYSWRDENYLLVWGRTEDHGDHYYLLDVRNGSFKIVGEGILDQFGDGHPSYSPDGRWIVTDTYPDKARQRHLLLFDTETESLLKLGCFFAPWEFDGSERCDLHPRWSPNGKMISIDSAHKGVRKSYIIDVRDVVS